MNADINASKAPQTLSAYQKNQAEKTLAKAHKILSVDNLKLQDISDALGEARFAQSITELMYENRIEERGHASAACMRSAMFEKIDLFVLRANKVLAKQTAKTFQQIGQQHKENQNHWEANEAFHQARQYAVIASQYGNTSQRVFTRSESERIEQAALKAMKETTGKTYQEQVRHKLTDPTLVDLNHESHAPIWEELSLDNFRTHKLLHGELPIQGCNKLV